MRYEELKILSHILQPLPIPMVQTNLSIFRPKTSLVQAREVGEGGEGRERDKQTDRERECVF